MLLWLGKKLLFCLILLSLFYHLNQRNPQWMESLGRLVNGEFGNKVSVAVSNFLDGEGEKGPLAEALEVFREQTED